MKQKLHKIGSLVLAFVVLFSSFSYTVNKHICGDKVIDTSLFVNATSCGMEMGLCENNSQSTQTTTEMSKKDCCHDSSVLIKGNDTNQQAQEMPQVAPHFDFIFSFVYTFVLNRKPITPTLSANYNPPLVFKDTQSLFQVFRI